MVYRPAGAGKIERLLMTHHAISVMKYSLLLFWVVVASVLSKNSLAQDGVFTGYARDPQTNTLLYVESHYVKRLGSNDEQRVVLYRCDEQGPAFARKTLSYASGRLAPDFRFEDARLGYLEGLQRKGPLKSVFLRDGRDVPERNASLKTNQSLVADAGFDEFVRQNWSQLEAGESLRFYFLVPSRLDYLSFKIKKVGETRIDNEPASIIQLNLSGVLGWFLPNIEVSYRQRDRALMRYAGVTNVRDLQSRNVVARIDFPATERRLTDPLDFDALRQQPLIERCPAS